MGEVLGDDGLDECAAFVVSNMTWFWGS
jgi:hypothetical protein